MDQRSYSSESAESNQHSDVGQSIENEDKRKNLNPVYMLGLFLSLVLLLYKGYPQSLPHPSSPSPFVIESEESEESESPIDLLNRILNEINSLPQDSTPVMLAMDGFEHARAMKRKVETNISTLPPPDSQTATRHSPQEDPESVLIMAMRNDQKMKWTVIANALNDARREQGEAADFTDKKVYCRYIQASARVALPAREIGFAATDYQFLHDPHQSADGGAGPTSKSRNSRKRIKNMLNPTELKTNLRQVLGSEESADLRTPEKTEQLLRAVARVERNFWVLVADEMERETTKLYEPGLLAACYHAL